MCTTLFGICPAGVQVERKNSIGRGTRPEYFGRFAPGRQVIENLGYWPLFREKALPSGSLSGVDDRVSECPRLVSTAAVPNHRHSAQKRIPQPFFRLMLRMASRASLLTAHQPRTTRWSLSASSLSIGKALRSRICPTAKAHQKRTSRHGSVTFRSSTAWEDG